MNEGVMRNAVRISPEEHIARLGGADFVKARYPEIYKAYLNTVNGDISGIFAPKSKDEYIEGTVDSYKVRTLNYDPDTTLETSSSVETKQIKSSVAIVGELTDADFPNKPVDGFAVYDTNCQRLSGSCGISSSFLRSGDSKRFLSKSTFSVVDYVNGKPILLGSESIMDAVKTVNDSPIVKSISVTSPMPKCLSAEETVVYYNRSGSGSDYSYSNVSITDTEIDVFIPFEGSVEFDGDFQVNPSNPVDMASIILELEHLKNSCATFDMDYASQIQITASGSTLKWIFPDEWHDAIQKSILSASNIVDFYCYMKVNMTSGLAVPIVILSDGAKHPDPSYKNIPHIRLMWGCFAKDVMIRMGDGSCKEISEIKKGDIVSTKEKGPQTVKSITTGKEEQLVYIESSRGNNIRVTDDHPVLTTEGMVKAGELTAGSILVTPYGDAQINGLYYVEYHDTVFNLELENSGVLSANDFYTGDFTEQNAGIKFTDEKSDMPLTEIQEEFNDLFKSINKNQTERKD